MLLQLSRESCVTQTTIDAFAFLVDELGCAIDAVDMFGRGVLHNAFANCGVDNNNNNNNSNSNEDDDHMRFARLCLSRATDAMFRQRDTNGATPIVAAVSGLAFDCRARAVPVLRMLVAECTRRFGKDETSALLELPITAKVVLNFPAAPGATPLLCCANSMHTSADALAFLIDELAVNRHAVDSSNQNALRILAGRHLGSASDARQAAELLLQRGVRPDVASTRDGANALVAAMELGQTHVVRVILQHVATAA
jgi:hypothetical protein